MKMKVALLRIFFHSSPIIEKWRFLRSFLSVLGRDPTSPKLIFTYVVELLILYLVWKFQLRRRTGTYLRSRIWKKKSLEFQNFGHQIVHYDFLSNFCHYKSILKHTLLEIFIEQKIKSENFGQSERCISRMKNFNEF